MTTRFAAAAAAVAALCLAACPLAANSASPVTAPTPNSGVPASSGHRAAESSAPSRMSEAQLEAVSGGQAPAPAPVALTVQNLTAQDGGNTISAANVQSGAVSFGAGTLQGFNGIGNFVINTGNNNILQGSLSVTVTPLH